MNTLLEASRALDRLRRYQPRARPLIVRPKPTRAIPCLELTMPELLYLCTRRPRISYLGQRPISLLGTMNALLVVVRTLLALMEDAEAQRPSWSGPEKKAAVLRAFEANPPSELQVEIKVDEDSAIGSLIDLLVEMSKGQYALNAHLHKPPCFCFRR